MGCGRRGGLLRPRQCHCRWLMRVLTRELGSRVASPLLRARTAALCAAHRRASASPPSFGLTSPLPLRIFVRLGPLRALTSDARRSCVPAMAARTSGKQSSDGSDRIWSDGWRARPQSGPAGGRRARRFPGPGPGFWAWSPGREAARLAGPGQKRLGRKIDEWAKFIW